jgi:tRNA dimethylallyltransferase
VPSSEELASVKHHFIQVASVTKPYNASMFEFQVLDRLEELFTLHDIILMVGGSGLYINAVCHGIDDLPSVDPVLRENLLSRYKHEGLESLSLELLKLDPVSYAKVDLKNHLRVLKALEITLQTGKPYSSFLSASRKERSFRILRVALDMDRELLYNRINRRVETMMGNGLLDEVKSLKPLRNYTAMKTVGYRELFRHLDGELSLDEAVDLIQRNTRKFARKQLTWFRKDNLYQWFSPEDDENILRWIESEDAYL